MRIEAGIEWFVEDRFSIIAIQFQKVDYWALHLWFMGIGISIIFD